MDVTNDTFDEMLPRVAKALETCGFFSLDAEMTGLHLTDPRREEELDDPDQRYVRVKQSAQSFLIMQVGLSMFEFDEAERCYNSQTFNFYIFPRNSDVRFTCQASSLEFLKKHGFDFNKFIYSGIPYQTLAQQLLFQKSKQKAEEKRQQPIVLTNQADLTFVSQQIERTRQWLYELQQCVGENTPGSPSDQKRGITENSDPSSAKQRSRQLLLDPCNSYIRAVLHQELKKQFGKQQFYVDTLQCKTKSTLMNLKLTAGSAESIASTEAKIVAEKQRQYVQAVGFGHVVQLLVASKKPLVGHNMFTDVCYFYHQFIGLLPPTFEEFRQKMMLLFSGGVYDTKYLAELFPRLFPPTVGTSLEDVYCMFAKSRGGPTVQPNVCDELSTVALHSQNAETGAAEVAKASLPSATCMKEQGYVGGPVLLPSLTEDSQSDSQDYLTEVHLPRVHHAEGYCRYKDVYKQNNSFGHEAGYDAFMTGAIFVWLGKLLGARSSKHQGHSECGHLGLQSLMDPVLQFANRLHFRKSDIPYLPLKGEYVMPDRSTLFYLFATLENLPSPHEIVSRLANMGFEVSRIIWLNPSTCYVDLKDRGHVDNFIQAVSDSQWSVRVMAFREVLKRKTLEEGLGHGPKRKVYAGGDEDSTEGLRWPRSDSSERQHKTHKGQVSCM